MAGFLWFCVLLWMFPLPQQKAVEINAKPYDESFGVGYSISEPKFIYSQQISSLQAIDPKNFVLHTFDEKGHHLVCGELHGGYWEGVEKNGVSMDTLRWRGWYMLNGHSEKAVYAVVWVVSWHRTICLAMRTVAFPHTMS